MLKTITQKSYQLAINFHFWIIILLFLGAIFLHYPQIIPAVQQLDPESFLFITRHSIGRLILLLPIAYTALVFGIRAGLFSLLIAIGIMIPNVFLLEQITADDVIEIIGVVLIGLIANLWLESYVADRRHRQEAYVRLESAQRELQRMQQNLRFYLKQITIAQEEERRRIAQELHDDTAQDLVVISRKLDDYINNHDSINEKDKELLEALQQQIDRTLSEVRRFSQDLRPSILDDLGLLPAIEWLLPEISEHFGVKTELKINGRPRRFPPETELVLFRIIQESLRNIGKHANASSAFVILDYGNQSTEITIKDDGKGFKVPDRISDLAVVGKLGLVGIYERAQLVGANLSVSSKPGQGTVLKIVIRSPDTLRKDLTK